MEGFPWLWDSALPCMQLVNAPNWKYPGGTFNQWLVSMGGSTSHVPWIQVWDDTKVCYTPLPKVYRCPERWPHWIPRALLAAFPSLPHCPPLHVSWNCLLSKLLAHGYLSQAQLLEKPKLRQTPSRRSTHIIFYYRTLYASFLAYITFSHFFMRSLAHCLICNKCTWLSLFPLCQVWTSCSINI